MIDNQKEMNENTWTRKKNLLVEKSLKKSDKNINLIIPIQKVIRDSKHIQIILSIMYIYLPMHLQPNFWSCCSSIHYHSSGTKTGFVQSIQSRPDRQRERRKERQRERERERERKRDREIGERERERERERIRERDRERDRKSVV